MLQTLPISDGRYQILAQLGSGGMGSVYKARDQASGDVVALKILHPAVAGQPDLVERLKTELRLARKITHKNVCRVYDISRLGEMAAISMEYMDGESLRALLDRRQRLALPEAFGIVRQVLAGLSEAHAQGVVHRDLKPENIFINADGAVKVMDFGLARATDGSGVTTDGAILGTPAYMSPEQVAGKAADARSDIYSLGMVIYELVCGKRAFGGDTPIAIAMKQLHEPPPSLRDSVPDLPDYVEAAVLKCLQKDPSQRYQDLATLNQALIETGPVGSETAVPAAAARSKAPVARNAAYAMGLLAVVSTGTWYALHGNTGGGPSSPEPPRDSAAPAIIVPAKPTAQPTTPPTAAAPAGQKISIAALPFQGIQKLQDYVGLTLGIPDAFAVALTRSGRFRVVERTQLDATAMKEIELSQTGRIEPDTAQRIGKLIGAQYLVIGSFQVFGGKIRIDARLISAETGRLVNADSVTGAASDALILPDSLAERMLKQIK